MTQAQPLMARLERTAVWRLKLRLQFTGWLQYLPPAMVGVVLAAVGGLGALLGAPAGVAVAITALGGLGVLVTGFDLLTAKHDLRPREAIPAPRDHLDPFELMRSRRSCRSYQSRNLTDEHRAALLASAAECSRPAAQLGESPIRFEYVAAPLTVWPVVGAHEFLVAIAPREYDRIGCDRRRTEPAEGGHRRDADGPWHLLDRARGGPRSVTANLGDRFDPEQRPHHLRVRRRLRLAVRPRDDPSHESQDAPPDPPDQTFFADSGSHRPLDITTSPFDAFGRCYEVCQWSPSSYNGQTTRCVGMTERRGRACQCGSTSTPSPRRATTPPWRWGSGGQLGDRLRGPRHRRPLRVLSADDRGSPISRSCRATT